MRQNQAFIPTLRRVAEADMVSHQLLLRAGYIRQVAAGVYNYLPLAWRVLNKIQTIVREEMNAIGGQELLMPTLTPSELWKETGRWENYGSELVRLKDRHERDFLIGPTHEETITDLVRKEIRSYKQLPTVLYQIQTKFRDERRPRSGLLRGREFLMKDAYSFHTDTDSLAETYDHMYQAYVNILTRCGFDFRVVEADSGAIGGKGTHEFMVLSDAGEDVIALCKECDYAANIEMAEVVTNERQTETGEIPVMQPVATPHKKSIQEVSKYLQVSPQQMVKSLLFMVDNQPVLVLVRGDHEVNEVKVKNWLNANLCELADEQTVENYIGCVPGFIGPVGLSQKIRIVADSSLKIQQGFVVGANEVDKHLLHVQWGRDVTIDQFADVRNIQSGDQCPRCGGEIDFQRGIEVGHIFKLGTRYSKDMDASFLDENGAKQPVIMGCYGIGISRILSAIIEQHHDENGIIWPASVTPYDVHLILVNSRNEEQKMFADEIYELLRSVGVDVLFDDRDERAGVKFKDADLIGIPYRLVVGAKAKDRIIEWKVRGEIDSSYHTIEEIMQRFKP